MKKTLVVLFAAAVILAVGGTAIAASRTFAVVFPIINPFFEATSHGAEDEAKSSGVEVLIKGPDRFDVQQQIEIVENLIAMKVDGFGIGPIDPKALTPLLNRAMEQGIKVVTFDTDAPDSKRLGYIGTDNVKAGEHMGEALGVALGGKGKVLVSQGISSQLNLVQRLEGVQKILKEKYPDVEIVDVQSGQGDPNKTLSNIEDMVSAHPDFDALIGMDSYAGPAMVTAWKAKGLKQIAITFDDLPEVINGVRDGQIYSAIVQRQYAWGVNVVNQLNMACDGKPIPANSDTGTLEITKTNVDEFYPK
ncbi:MAG: substrate-binding domain-containing protein [Synergistaceae bacterium]|jgi:ribose transport system substrate-binding protein|nr:substrate-binding domain-containing protein [Synergistaceae bacterium]